MTQRQGIGRVRHLDASLLWIQQKEKIITVAAIYSLKAQQRRYWHEEFGKEALERLALHDPHT